MISCLALIQAHMNSKRLPGKVMRKLCSMPMIRHVAERVRLSNKIGRIVVAASLEGSDDPLCDYLRGIGLECFRGSEADVLDRFYRASKMYPSEAVVRVTSDNPLIDPKILDQTILFFKEGRYDYVRTGGFPAGIGAEVFKTPLLTKAFKYGKTPYEREHVTPYMYAGQENCGVLTSRETLEHLRFTVDTEEDFHFMEEIYANFYRGTHDFFLDDIVNYLKTKRNTQLHPAEDHSDERLV